MQGGGCGQRPERSLGPEPGPLGGSQVFWGLEAVAYNLRQMHTDTGALSLASRAWAGIQPPFTTAPPPPKNPQVPLGSAQLEPPSMAALTSWPTI